MVQNIILKWRDPIPLDCTCIWEFLPNETKRIKTPDNDCSVHRRILAAERAQESESAEVLQEAPKRGRGRPRKPYRPPPSIPPPRRKDAGS